MKVYVSVFSAGCLMLAACGADSKNNTPPSPPVEEGAGKSSGGGQRMTRDIEEKPDDKQNREVRRVARQYTSQPAASADVLVLDSVSSPRLFLTSAARRLVASYHLNGTSLEAQNFRGTVTEQWQNLERECVSGSYRDLIERDALTQEELVREYFRIDANFDPTKLSNRHAETVMETLLAHNQDLTIVFAQDFTEDQKNCALYEEDESARVHVLRKIRDSYREMIRRHGIKVVSRSMRRGGGDEWPKWIMRQCDSATFEGIAEFFRLEQQMLEDLASTSGALFVNAAKNDPEELEFYFDGEMRRNLVLDHTPDSPLFVGYVNQPDIDFFEEGVIFRDHWLPPNQAGAHRVTEVYIDGNMDEARYDRAVQKFGSNWDLSASERLTRFIEEDLVWWRPDSFRYVFGQIAWFPWVKGPGTIETSGMATSWATPLAAAMVLKMQRDAGLDFNNELDRNSLQDALRNRIFDPIHHNQF